MNQTKTLSEICRSLGVSRKVIQGYEKHGFVKSCGKNRYGHLVYDSESIDRITEIRFYQYLGFSLKEIENVLDADEKKRIDLLSKKDKQHEEHIKDLKEKQAFIRRLIEKKQANIKSNIDYEKEDD